MTDRIYLSAPDVRESERRVLAEAVDSNWIAPVGPALADVPKVAIHDVPNHHQPNYWMTCIVIAPDAGFSPEQLRLQLESDNIESRSIWKPMHRQPVFEHARSRTNDVSARTVVR